MLNKLKYVLRNHKNIINNISYISILQVFLLIAPLVTYPYLVRVLGADIYGLIITAQVLSSYFSLLIDFGSNSVCAKHVSVNREDPSMLSEVVSSVLLIRGTICILGFLLYSLIVFLVPSYREHFLLFCFSYGLTFNEVLFPQYFFQGIEKMKYTTFINILIKSIFIILVFIIVRKEGDYFYVPLLYTIGYTFGGVVALYSIFIHMKIKFVIPSYGTLIYYVKDCFPVLATDLICTIKDKLNYFLIGSYIGMDNVVVYDLALKINALIYKPVDVLKMAFFPHSAKNRSLSLFYKLIILVLCISIFSVISVNIFLPQIVDFFIDRQIDLWPIRLFTIAPIILSVSVMLASNAFIAWGYNKYLLISIIFTTLVYLVLLSLLFIFKIQQYLLSVILLALMTYLAELIYRLYAFVKIKDNIEK